jgi:hypothetical protein
MTPARTKEWASYLAFGYEGTSITDEGNRIVLTFRSDSIIDGGFGALATGAGGLLGGGLMAIGLVPLFSRYAAVGLVMEIIGFAVGIGPMLLSRTSSQGHFSVGPETFTFARPLDGDERTVALDLFGGLQLVDRNVQEQIGDDSSNRTYTQLVVRYGAVQSVVGLFKSRARAEEMALLIGEAMRQELSDEAGTHTPFSGAPRVPTQRDRFPLKADDDL